MYLEFLEKKGIFVRDLAVKHLAQKAHETEGLISARIIDEKNEDDMYCFTTLEVVCDNITEVENYFTDMDYSTNFKSGKRMPHDIDRNWVKLVYSALDVVSSKKAEEYKQHVLSEVKKFLTAYRHSKVGEFINPEKTNLDSAKKIEKAYKKLEAEITFLKNDFENVFDSPLSEEYVLGL